MRVKGDNCIIPNLVISYTHLKLGVLKRNLNYLLEYNKIEVPPNKKPINLNRPKECYSLDRNSGYKINKARNKRAGR